MNHRNSLEIHKVLQLLLYFNSGMQENLVIVRFVIEIISQIENSSIVYINVASLKALVMCNLVYARIR